MRINQGNINNKWILNRIHYSSHHYIASQYCGALKGLSKEGGVEEQRCLITFLLWIIPFCLLAQAAPACQSGINQPPNQYTSSRMYLVPGLTNHRNFLKSNIIGLLFRILTNCFSPVLLPLWNNKIKGVSLHPASPISSSPRRIHLCWLWNYRENSEIKKYQHRWGVILRPRSSRGKEQIHVIGRICSAAEIAGRKQNICSALKCLWKLLEEIPNWIEILTVSVLQNCISE